MHLKREIKDIMVGVSIKIAFSDYLHYVFIPDKSNN